MRITGFPTESMTRYTELMHEKLPDEGHDEMWQIEETEPVLFRSDLREFACVSSNEAQQPAVLGKQGLANCLEIEQMF